MLLVSDRKGMIERPGAFYSADRPTVHKRVNVYVFQVPPDLNCQTEDVDKCAGGQRHWYRNRPFATIGMIDYDVRFLYAGCCARH